MVNKPHIDPDWPKCHFKTMTLHDDDYAGSGFACDHCGHTLSFNEWIANNPVPSPPQPRYVVDDDTLAKASRKKEI